MTTDRTFALAYALLTEVSAQLDEPVPDVFATTKRGDRGAAHEPWMHEAACLHVSEIFVQTFIVDPAPHVVDTARSVCRTCPVQRECLDFALDREERFGMWGGLMPEERGEDSGRSGFGPREWSA